MEESKSIIALVAKHVEELRIKLKLVEHLIMTGQANDELIKAYQETMRTFMSIEEVVRLEQMARKMEEEEENDDGED